MDQGSIVQTDANGNKKFSANKISTWTIEQIFEKLGSWTLSHEHSRKESLVAFVLVTDSIKPMVEAELVVAGLCFKHVSAERSIPIRLRDVCSLSSEMKLVCDSWEAIRGISTLEAFDLQSFRKWG